MTQLTIRPLGRDDEPAVHELFRSTLAMGRPLPFELPLLDDYAALCLDWYLTEERDGAAVAEDRSGVVGYALVCVDSDAQHRWARRRAARFARLAVLAAARGQLKGDARRFVALRMRDAVSLLAAPVPRPVHAHLNLDRAIHGSWAAPLLLEHIDAVCRTAGATGWYGEVNARVGRRAAALARLVGPVVHRTPNRTCTWLAGVPVERLLVVRDV